MNHYEIGKQYWHESVLITVEDIQGDMVKLQGYDQLIYYGLLDLMNFQELFIGG